MLTLQFHHARPLCIIASACCSSLELKSSKSVFNLFKLLVRRSTEYQNRKLSSALRRLHPSAIPGPGSPWSLRTSCQQLYNTLLFFPKGVGVGIILRRSQSASLKLWKNCLMTGQSRIRTIAIQYSQSIWHIRLAYSTNSMFRGQDSVSWEVGSKACCQFEIWILGSSTTFIV